MNNSHGGLDMCTQLDSEFGDAPKPWDVTYDPNGKLIYLIRVLKVF